MRFTAANKAAAFARAGGQAHLCRRPRAARLSRQSKKICNTYLYKKQVSAEANTHFFNNNRINFSNSF